MESPEPRARVRLTDDAVADLRRLEKKDPQIVRAVFKKMLLLERAPDAGEPLLGALIGFRKLVVGDRAYRIVWRQTTDDAHRPVLEVAEVWAVGARADSEVYDEMMQRAATLEQAGHPRSQSLAAVVREMGRLYSEATPQPEPATDSGLPEWLRQALRENLSLTPGEIGQLTRSEAQRLLVEHWSKPTP